MTTAISVIEVVKRASQGATLPFLCRCENDELFWAKGKDAGTMALCTEWVIGRLGQYFSLPIPELAILEVPEILVAESAFPNIEDLGAGFCFASKHIDGVQEYDNAMIDKTDERLRWRILVFDYWVKNTDRTFTRPFGGSGNPNLLWQMGSGELYVIDHNNALLPNDMLDINNYRNHVFARERGRLTSSFKLEIESNMADAFKRLPAIFDEVPESWLYLDSEHAVRSDISLKYIQDMLEPMVRDPKILWEMLK